MFSSFWMPAPRLREDKLRGHDNILFNFPIATQSLRMRGPGTREITGLRIRPGMTGIRRQQGFAQPA